MITLVRNSGHRWLDKDGTPKVQATFVSPDTPSSLEVSGADVEGMAEGEVIATGSVLITPDKNYIAFEDGVFTQKG